MLRELLVEGFALIEKACVSFSPGLNVLTGETGAGKSLLIDAVGLLTGGRASQDFIRTGADKALVEGVFNGTFPAEITRIISEAGIACDDDTLILTREIMRNGKNICRVNSRVVPLGVFRELGCRMINIHGQHENIALLDEDNQLLLLDSYGGAEIAAIKKELAESYRAWQAISSQINKQTENKQQIEKQSDFLQFQINEINEAEIHPEEDQMLEKERRFLQNAEKLSREGKKAYHLLAGAPDNGAVDLIGQAVGIFKEISLPAEKTEEFSQRLQEQYYLLEDLSREISNYIEDIVFDQMRLEEVEQRIYLLNKLKKKYGGTIEEILIYADQAQEELALLINHEENLLHLEQEQSKALDKYGRLSAQLTVLRKTAGEKLCGEINQELTDLKMADAEFMIKISPGEKKSSGQDKAIFMIRTNLGEDFKPVARIASGGELSRIMLCIKMILAQLDQIPTLIFDEIDSGLGGSVIYSVGEKLEIISSYTQVLCVTHSPVIASFADRHMTIAKHLEQGRTMTEIGVLTGEEIVGELCRMLAGDQATATTAAQAQELLNHKKKY